MFDYQDFGGLRGLAPVLPSGSPHRPIARFRSNPPTIAEYAPMRGNLLCKREQSETQFQLYRVQPATDESQIAAVAVKIRNVDFDVLDSTTLPISGFNVAMCGDDEVARNRFNALLRKEMEVQGQRNGKHSEQTAQRGCRVTCGATGLCCWAWHCDNVRPLRAVCRGLL